MKFTVVSMLSLSIILTACATYPQSREDQATYHTNKAKIAISNGETIFAAGEIEEALDRPSGKIKIKELFITNPNGREIYKIYIEKRISDVSSPSDSINLFKKLTIAKESEIFSETQINSIFSKLNIAVINGNKSGLLQFDLSDTIDAFPDLKLPENDNIIINRSIKKLQTNSRSNRPIEALMNYVEKIGKNSDAGKNIELLLPTMNIRNSEIEIVARIFPKYSEIRKNEITARVFVSFKNADRLLSDDIRHELKDKIRGVDWIKNNDSKTINIVIERLRNDEKIIPERSETITYAQHEVNLFSAALLMPRNASYIYDVVSGGSEIEYGYVISAVADKKIIYDEIIRGKLEGKYVRCQNSRIQNVFGGVTSAGFIANDDMQRRCSGPSSSSIEDLRKNIFSKIVDDVLNIPPIKFSHELN